ncbi:MAG: DUF2933 domain-containing protein [Betaproteobacteria bacterium]|jgi:Protein of unknown function (DUF2933).|nr:DUF2933 domain-containing protein [Betaproteobacteria bacterium]
MNEPNQENCPMGLRPKIAWIVFAAIVGFYLWTEHRAHLLGALPFLLFLAFVLTHLFMHDGHGHGHVHGGENQGQQAKGENK